MKKTITFLTHEDEEGSFILSYDFDGNLYLNGKKVITENKIIFNWWVNLAAVLGGIGAFGVFMIDLLKVIKFI